MSWEALVTLANEAIADCEKAISLAPDTVAALYTEGQAYEGLSKPKDATGFYTRFVELAGKDQRVCAVTMEYGTLGHSLEKQIEGWNSFFLDHQGQFYGFTTEQLAREIKDENLLKKER